MVQATGRGTEQHEGQPLGPLLPMPQKHAGGAKPLLVHSPCCWQEVGPRTAGRWPAALVAATPPRPPQIGLLCQGTGSLSTIPAQRG